MASVEPAEIEELRGHVLEIIGAYRMGDSNPRELYPKKTARSGPPPASSAGAVSRRPASPRVKRT